MTRKYYLKNMLLGCVVACIVIYVWSGEHREFVVLVSIIHAILFPFSRMLIENSILRVTSKKFWTSGYFTDVAPKSGLFAIYYLLGFILAVPFSILYFIFFTLKDSSLKS